MSSNKHKTHMVLTTTDQTSKRVHAQIKELSIDEDEWLNLAASAMDTLIPKRVKID